MNNTLGKILVFKNSSEVLPFGQCPHDYWLFYFLAGVWIFMIIGNLSLVGLLKKCYEGSRTDWIVANQAIIDFVYTIIFPGVLIDARRQLKNEHSFYGFKVAEDSLLTLSVLAVLFVNIHKYLFIRHQTFYFQNVPTHVFLLISVTCWIAVPVCFSYRNALFVCAENRPCALSYLRCLAGVM